MRCGPPLDPAGSCPLTSFRAVRATAIDTVAEHMQDKLMALAGSAFFEQQDEAARAARAPAARLHTRPRRARRGAPRLRLGRGDAGDCARDGVGGASSGVSPLTTTELFGWLNAVDEVVALVPISVKSVLDHERSSHF